MARYSAHLNQLNSERLGCLLYWRLAQTTTLHNVRPCWSAKDTVEHADLAERSEQDRCTSGWSRPESDERECAEVGRLHSTHFSVRESKYRHGAAALRMDLRGTWEWWCGFNTTAGVQNFLNLFFGLCLQVIDLGLHNR